MSAIMNAFIEQRDQYYQKRMQEYQKQQDEINVSKHLSIRILPGRLLVSMAKVDAKC